MHTVRTGTSLLYFFTLSCGIIINQITSFPVEENFKYEGRDGLILNYADIMAFLCD